MLGNVDDAATRRKVFVSTGTLFIKSASHCSASAMLVQRLIGQCLPHTLIRLMMIAYRTPAPNLTPVKHANCCVQGVSSPE
jgi:hypothetical protein